MDKDMISIVSNCDNFNLLSNNRFTVHSFNRGSFTNFGTWRSPFCWLRNDNLFCHPASVLEKTVGSCILVNFLIPLDFFRAEPTFFNIECNVAVIQFLQKLRTDLVTFDRRQDFSSERDNRHRVDHF